MNKKNVNDPHADREAAKYDNPIASREYILDILENSAGPLTLKRLIQMLNADDDASKEALRRRLIAMERDGQVVSNRRGAYGKIEKMSLIKGIVQGNKEGYGFVIPADGSPDLYLSNRQMRKVFSGDEVLARPGDEDYRGRREGAIVEVLTRNTRQLVGRIYLDRGFCFVRPENLRITQDISIALEDMNGAEHGQLVVVDIIQQPGNRQRVMGRVTEVLGDHLAPGMEIDVAIRSHDIPYEWPSEVDEQVKKIAPEVLEKDKKHRVDLRHLPFVTIDGEDARDFDDAVYCTKKRSGGWRLYVAIADVSHYVQEDSALDNEARARGNSVYFPDYVVPMLPEALSNGLCSLNPLVDRLCMVCEMTVSAAGRISGYKFYEAVMHSHARMTYTQVGKIVDEQGLEDSEIRNEFNELLPQFDELNRLYLALKEQRNGRGAIDFETKETRILFDEQRKISRIVPVVRNDAHKIIEECMLAANVSAARFLESLGIVSLYRVHESPKEEKLNNLHEFLGELGLSFKGGDIQPKDYREVLLQIQGRPDANIIQTVMLRSMNQAVYQSENLGHFGLAYNSYTHFTSPIRRYPDLMVHRAIRAVIRSDIDTNKVVRVKGVRQRKFDQLYRYDDMAMAVIGEQSSMTERRADDATRDVMSWLKCEFLQQHVGDEFDGVVSAVTGFGLFVELTDFYVEGLVHVTALPQDYFRYDAAQHRLVGERTRVVYRLGDQLRVKVVRVDLDERKVDFELVGTKPRKSYKSSMRTRSSKSNVSKVEASNDKTSKTNSSEKKAGKKPKTLSGEPKKTVKGAKAKAKSKKSSVDSTKSTTTTSKVASSKKEASTSKRTVTKRPIKKKTLVADTKPKSKPKSKSKSKPSSKVKSKAKPKSKASAVKAKKTKPNKKGKKKAKI